MPKIIHVKAQHYKVFSWLVRDKLAVTGALLVIAFSLITIFAPIIAPYPPDAQHLTDIMQPPTHKYLLGTDAYGRDVLSRIIFGSRVSLIVGVASVVLSMVIGVPIGIICAYFGKGIDLVVSRLVDVFMSFPALIFGLMLTAAMGPSLASVIIAIAMSLTPRFIRLARGSALSVVGKEYVEASRAIGASLSRIIFLHILPNIAGPIVVMDTLWIATSIRVEAGLSFLGLGIQPPTPSWGNMLKEGMDQIFMAPWMAIYPGLAIVIAVLAFNMIGDGIRDFLDPKKQV